MRARGTYLLFCFDALLPKGEPRTAPKRPSREGGQPKSSTRNTSSRRSNKDREGPIKGPDSLPTMRESPDPGPQRLPARGNTTLEGSPRQRPGGQKGREPRGGRERLPANRVAERIPGGPGSCIPGRGREPALEDEVPGILLPAPTNLHSHAFQRAMAGLTERRGADKTDSFWTWRQLMFRFLDKLTPDDVQAITEQVQMETLEAEIQETVRSRGTLTTKEANQ